MMCLLAQCSWNAFFHPCEKVTRDILGLCAGDVDGAYLPPNGYKTTGGAQTSVGTQNFVSLSNPAPIRFTLNESQLSELADGDGNVIDNVILSVADANCKLQTANCKLQNEGLVRVYPNPVMDILNVEFVISNIATSAIGTNTVGTQNFVSQQFVSQQFVSQQFVSQQFVSLRMFTMQGILVSTQNVTDVKPGLNKTTLDLGDIPNGAYMLKTVFGDVQETVKVIVNR